ncbi:hypothetical protein MHYP_G00050900 [Metynnis hypsauchen]
MVLRSHNPDYISMLNQDSDELSEGEAAAVLESQDPEYIHRLHHECETLLTESCAFQERDFPDPQRFTKALNINVKAGGHYGTYQFTNTCVLDSLLVALYICYISFELIQDLFRCDRRMSVIMTFLSAGRYDQAKAFWLINLNLISDSCRFRMHEEVDVCSKVEDHLPVFDDLVYAKYHYDDDRSSPRIYDEIHECTLSAFERYGDVKLLGRYADPHLILVNVDGRMGTAPPLYVNEYNRTFSLQFLLLWKKTERGNHMIGCNKVEDGWILYDNNPEKPSFSDFDIEHADFTNTFVIYLAGYVKSAQAEEIYEYANDTVPFGVPEEGSSAHGARPFDIPPRMPSHARPRCRQISKPSYCWFKEEERATGDKDIHVNEYVPFGVPEERRSVCMEHGLSTALLGLCTGVMDEVNKKEMLLMYYII